MSEPTIAAPPAAPRFHPAPVAASRLKRERDNIVIDSLNRGLSMAEIADAIGVSDKRMRALVREILARRQPAAPEEFAALQTSRLNAALGVAYDAMMKGDLRALDRVVTIVRELDRYAGFGLGRGARPESRSQPAEKIGFTPGIAMAADEADLGEASWEREFAPLSEPKQQRPPSMVTPLDAGPETPAQGLDKIDSAPGFSAAEPSVDLIEAGSEPAGAGVGQPDQGPPPLATPLDAGPETPSQSLGKVDSAPGFSEPNPARAGNSLPHSRSLDGRCPIAGEGVAEGDG